MEKSNPTRTDYDTAWKTVVEYFFKQLLEFFLPDVAKEIDWEKPITFLDKELLKIQRCTKTGNRHSDKLAKVSLKNGEQVCVLIHLELQGGYQKKFSERMYTYNVRIFDKYKIPIMSLAILTDSNENWRPTEYKRELWGCEVCLVYPMIKLIDFHAQMDTLEKSKDPIAKIVSAHLKALKAKAKPDLEMADKLNLIKSLYSLGYTGDDIKVLYLFIDYLFALPDDLEYEVMEKIKQYEIEVGMQYITTAERIGINKGIEQGIELGIQQGIEQGIEKGKHIFLLELIKTRFSFVPDNYIKKIECADENTLRKWAELLFKAISLEDIFNEESQSLAVE